MTTVLLILAIVWTLWVLFLGALNPMPIVLAFGYGLLTQTAGTLIQRIIRPVRRAYTRISQLQYVTGTNAHILTIRQALGTTTLSVASAGGATTITLTAQPYAGRAVAANDFLVVERPDPNSAFVQWDLVKVSSVAGLVLTIPAIAATTPYPAGARVWLLALNTDTIPAQGVTPPQYNVVASTTLTLPQNDNVAGLIGSGNKNEPLLVESNNVTAAGTLNYVTAYGSVT